MVRDPVRRVWLHRTANSFHTGFFMPFNYRRTAVLCVFYAVTTCLTICNAEAQAAHEKPSGSAPTPDVIVFNNGDQLTGKLVKVLAGDVTFHSDVVGDVTVPWTKVRTLVSAQPYAVIEKDNRVTKKTAADNIALGSIHVSDNTIHVTPTPPMVSIPPAPTMVTLSTKSTDYIIDEASFRKELRGESDWLYGWTGSITLGAALVQGTNNSETYTGAVNFVRLIPTLSWLPPVSKTTLDLSGTYGLLTQPQIVSGVTVIQASSDAKTDILHGDAEYDRYVSPRLYGLLNASADHNFGSGLHLQQTYGVGFGWSVLKSPKQNFDLKGDLHYEQQQFYNGVLSPLGTPNENLVGMDLTESWNRILVHDLKFNEYVTLTPAFNVVQAYSGVADVNLVVPLYKKFNFTLSSTDNYLGDPPIGYQRNTFQFTGGITYVLK